MNSVYLGVEVDEQCMHAGCQRRAVRIVSYERPNHREFYGQCHDCCSVHSRPTKSQTLPADEAGKH